jgi:hypothetical protein
VDEAGARTVLERLAAEAPPPSRVDIGLARRQGRRRLRGRRAAVPGASALAVVAVIAVVAGGVVPAGSRSSGPPRPTASRSGGPAGPPPAPATLNPLIPYAAFGWLPAGHVLQIGHTNPTADYLQAGPKPGTQGGDISLTVTSAGGCLLSAAMRPRQRPGQARFTCADSGVDTEVTAPAPAVHGRPAFWTQDRTQRYLVWQYARDGWAVLDSSLARPDVLKIADGVRFGPGASPAILFPVQLAGPLSAWRLVSGGDSVTFRPYLGALRASYWAVTQGDIGITISVDFAPAPLGLACPAANRVVGGYRVSVRDYPSLGGMPPWHDLCAPDADGLSVVIGINGKAAPDPVDVFARDTRLLGRDPANWAARPLG